MNSYITSVKEILSQQEISAVKELKRQEQQKVGLAYKLDLNFFSVTDGRARHLLYWEGETLKGYMAISCYNLGGGEVEITMIMEQDRKIFEEMYQALLNFTEAQEIKLILFIVDKKDVFLKECVAAAGAIHTFSEYSMTLEQDKFQPMESEVNLEKALPYEAVVIAGIEEADPAKEVIPLDPEDLKKTKVYREDGQIIACIRIEKSMDDYGIYGFVVREGHRGKGLGRNILSQVIQSILKEQPETIYLEVDTDNKPAHHLYRSLGFVETCQFDYYERSVGRD